MRKIIIFYANYGNGHFSAAKALKEAFVQKNIDVYTIDCIEYVSKFINKISTKAYKQGTKKTPKIWKFFYEKSNKNAMSKFVTMANSVMSLKLLNLINKINPDLIISVHPFSSQMCAILKKKGKIDCKLATVITDFHVHNQWLALPEYMNYYFVAADSTKESMKKFGISENKIYVTGIPISKKFSQKFDKNKIFKNYNLDPDKFTILFLGNAEFGKHKENPYEILKTLFKLSNKIQIIVTCGDNLKMYNKFKIISNETNFKNRVKILEYTNDIPNLMHISDIIITKSGGLITSESLASSLPILIMNPIPGQEEENADFLINSGCATYIKNSNDITDFYNDCLKNPKKLLKMKNAANTISKPNSTDKILEILGY